jgi:MFS family permease
MTTVADKHSDAERHQARRASAIILFCLGTASGSWATRLPSIKMNLHLSSSGLGLALTGTPVGLAIAALILPSITSRSSTALTARCGIGAAALAIVLPALMWNGPSLAAGLVVLGVAYGVCDISTNVEAIAVERAYDRPIMSGLHAMWSLGLLVGSLASAAATHAHVQPLPHLLVAGIAIAALGIWGARGLLGADRTEKAPDPEGTPTEPDRPPGRQLSVWLTIGVVAFCAFLVEGSVSDWSGVYLHSSQHASLGVAALAVSVYSAGALIGRLLGNRVIKHLNRTSTLWRTALIAAIGMGVAVAARSVELALAGYAVLGLGVAMIVPVAFSLAGTLGGGVSPRSLSQVTICAYAGLFLGPPVIGIVAGATDLSAALWVPCALLVLVALLSIRLRMLTRTTGW